LGPEEGNITLDETRTDGVTQVSNEENTLLTSPFTEDEVCAMFLNGKQSVRLFLAFKPSRRCLNGLNVLIL
jgi:hypothetical protein